MKDFQVGDIVRCTLHQRHPKHLSGAFVVALANLGWLCLEHVACPVWAEDYTLQERPEQLVTPELSRKLVEALKLSFKQHKHHVEIKAWADGAEIQKLVNGEWLDINDPQWMRDEVYRIKKCVKSSLTEANICEWLDDANIEHTYALLSFCEQLADKAVERYIKEQAK